MQPFRLSSIMRLLPFFALPISLLPVLVRGVDNCSTEIPPKYAYGWNCVFNPDRVTQLDIWSPWNDEAVFVDAFINATRIVAERNVDVKFIITLKSWGNVGGARVYRDELTEALLTDSEDAPELFAIGTRWLGYMQYRDLLSDLTERWKKERAARFKDTTMITSVENLWAPNDVWYSIPMQTDTMFLVYNKDTFAALNLSVPPFEIKDWRIIYSLASQVNSKATGKWGFGLYEANAYSSRILFPLVHQSSPDQGQLFNATQCLFNTPANIAAIEGFTNMWTVANVAGPTAKCERSANDGDMPRDALINITGGAAMMILAPGNLALIQNLTNEKGEQVNLGVSALPRAFLGGVGLSINTKASSGTAKVAFDVILEFVDPANKLLEDIAVRINSPPPMYPTAAIINNQPPWNVIPSAARAAFLGVSSGVDFSFPNYTLAYGYDVEEQSLFRCLMANITQGRMTAAEAVGDLCDNVNAIIQTYLEKGEAKKKTNVAVVILAIVIPILAIVIAILTIFVIISCRKRKAGHRKLLTSRRPLEELTNLRKFSSKELTAATDSFSEKNLLGRGGFGEVYSGVLPGGVPVAVKKLRDNSYDHDEEFINEVKIISAVRHKNLVGLLGYCIDHDYLMLAYELMPNGSLEDLLFKTKRTVTWEQCYQILTGTAEGIAYLHHGCQQRIIHRDIKPANILLDAKLQVRVSDFGMAKDTNVEDTHVSTRIMGTLGYLDPCYSRTGQLTEKSDVYSFGMVMIVMLLGRKPFDCEILMTSSKNMSHVVVISEWLQCVGESALDKIKDRFQNNLNEEEARNCLLVAILCIQGHQEARPTMSQVVQMLKGEVMIPRIPLKEAADVIIPNYTSTSQSVATTSASFQASPLGVAGGAEESKGFSYQFSAITPR